MLLPTHHILGLSDFDCNPLVLTQVDLFISEARVCPDVEVTPDSDAEHTTSGT